MKKSMHGEGSHSKHGHKHMHEVHKAEGGKVEGTMKMTSDSDGTSSGLPDSAGASGGHSYAKGKGC